MTAQESLKSALLIMDLQNEMVDPNGYFGAAGMAKVVAERGVVENTRRVLERARAAGVDVVFVRLAFREDYADSLSLAPRVAKFKAAKAAIAGTWGTEFPDALKPLPHEMIVTKQAVNPFFNTGLLTWLLTRDVRRLVLCGVSTNAVVEATARYADDAGFRVTVLEDCCAAGNIEMHRFAVEKILPMFGEVSSGAQYIESLRSS